MLGRYIPRDSERQDDLYGGEVRDSGEREAVVYSQHLFVPASNMARL